MGSSASKPNTFVTQNHPHHIHYSPENNPFSPSPAASASSFSLESTTYSSFSHFSSPKPVTKALSLPTPLVHHPPSKKGDSQHLVSLTSTTYGSLLLIDRQVSPLNSQDCLDHHHHHHSHQSPQHKTQTPTNPVESLSPDSVINTWELMDGLDDDFACDLGQPISSSNYQKIADPCGSVKGKDEIVVEDSPSLKKPLWKHLSEESLLSKMDPNVASSYRRALSSRQLGYSHYPRKTSSLGSSPVTSSLSNEYSHLPGTKNQIVIYFTSLRGIRKTYEDCCSVRMIFKGYRVGVDERDISMDSTNRKELQQLLAGKAVSLPQVFIGGKHIGGAEEIKQLNETGELVKLLQGLPVVSPTSVCESCGDARFVPCPNCCGSRKVFDQAQDQMRRCPDCNENGLIRCPACSC